MLGSPRRPHSLHLSLSLAQNQMSALIPKSKRTDHARKLGIYPKRRLASSRRGRRGVPIPWVTGPFPPNDDEDEVENGPFRFYPADFRLSILAGPVNLVTSVRADSIFHYCGIDRSAPVFWCWC